MFVQQVVMPSSRRKSWTVLGGDGVPIGTVERFLAFLTDVERSPNTVAVGAVEPVAEEGEQFAEFCGIGGVETQVVSGHGRAFVG